MLTLSSKATGECILCLCHLPDGRTSQGEEVCEEANLYGSGLAALWAVPRPAYMPLWKGTWGL